MKKIIFTIWLSILIWIPKSNAQLTAFEIGYSPISSISGIQTDYNLKAVYSLGILKYRSATTYSGLSLDYGFIRNSINNGVNFTKFINGQIAYVNVNSDIIRLNANFYGTALGELDLPFQTYAFAGFSVIYESSKLDIINPQIFSEEDLKANEVSKLGFHGHAVIGFGMQYNFNRNVGIRLDGSFGLGANQYFEMSGSLFPKIGLFIKPDKMPF
jgi:hypothetical protein